MKLLDMNEWAEICKIHHPFYILKKPAAIGYWKSSISEHEWKLIPQGWGFFDHPPKGNKRGHLMWETTLFERMNKK